MTGGEWKGWEGVNLPLDIIKKTEDKIEDTDDEI